MSEGQEIGVEKILTKFAKVAENIQMEIKVREYERKKKTKVKNQISECVEN